MGSRRKEQVPRGAPRVTLGESIRKHREAKGWTQSELARKIGVADSRISVYERDGAVPQLKQLLALAEIFEVSLDVLVGRSES